MVDLGMSEKKICLACGKEYKPDPVNFNRQKFCSQYCKSHCRSRRDDLVYQCKACLKDFHPKSAERKTFCSRECAYSYGTFHKQAKKIKKKLELLSHKCKCCGKMSLTVHCSRECELKSLRNDSKLKWESSRILKTLQCKYCNKVFRSSNKKKFCSKVCLKKFYHIQYHHNYKHRLRHVTVKQAFKRLDIAARDGWICGLCHKKINKRIKAGNPKSMVIDHIIPLAKGGTHEPKNVQIAHAQCNWLKRDLPVGEQMRLI